MPAEITQDNILVMLMDGYQIQHAEGMEDFARAIPIGGGMFTKIDPTKLRGMKRAGVLDGTMIYPYKKYTLTGPGRALATALKMEADPSWEPPTTEDSANESQEEPNMSELAVAPAESAEVVAQIVEAVRDSAAEAGVPTEVVEAAIVTAAEETGTAVPAPKAKTPRAPKPAIVAQTALAQGESFQAGVPYTALLLAQDTNWTGAFLAKKPAGSELWSTVQYFPDIKRALKVKIARQTGDGDAVKEVCNFVDVSQALVLVAK